MNRTPRLSESDIEYLRNPDGSKGRLWTFYSGCENKERGICTIPNCWARAITKRFKQHYPNGFEPTFYPEAFLSPLYLKKPSRIGVAFMGDLFGDWIDPEMGLPALIQDTERGRKTYLPATTLKRRLFAIIESCPQHTFIFLTKCPWNLHRWSPFPSNCFVGVSVTNQFEFNHAVKYLRGIDATVKFLSMEPLLDRIQIATW